MVFFQRLLGSAAILALAATAVSAPLTAAGQDQPTFTYRLEPCPAIIEGLPGSSFERRLEVVLDTSDNPSASVGASAWSFSIAAEGCTVIEVTDQGTVAASVDDVPPGLRDPDGGSSFGFIMYQLATRGTQDCEGYTTGAVGACVLSLLDHVTLPPRGDAVIARLRIAGRLPEVSGEAAGARLSFLDGCQGFGMPNSNGITWKHLNHPVNTFPCQIVLSSRETSMRRGDCSNDGAIDISDPICILHWLFLGDATPGCLAATNANGDPETDISDALYLLDHLFLGGPPPAAPFLDCGPGTLPADEAMGCETPLKNCPR